MNICSGFQILFCSGSRFSFFEKKERTMKCSACFSFVIFIGKIKTNTYEFIFQ